MPRLSVVRAFCSLAIFLMMSTLSAMGASRDRFQMNRDIRIESDDKVGDVTCLNCSIYVRGQVAGDVLTIHGNVLAQQGAAIGGDITAIGGNARVENGTQVAGDLVAIGGTVRRDPQASVAGDVTSMGGEGWIFLIFLLPFAFLGGLVALIIWLIRRSRRPAPVPAYTLRRN
jgi:hypothetical protein